jgi:hypothetical protein
MRVSFTFSPAQLQKLDRVRCDLQLNPIAAALSATVTDADAARFLLYRALDAYMGLQTPDGELPGYDRPRFVPSATVEDGVEGENDDKSDESRPEMLEIELDDGEDDEEEVKTYPRPHIWDYFDQGEWDFPPSQREMHRYYTNAGWIRFAAALGDRTIEGYWSPALNLQGLPAYPGRDANNRGIVKQKSPDVGVAHLIPDDWDEEPGHTHEAVWSPQ